MNLLNVAEEKQAEAIQKNDLNGSLALQAALRFNGGGHINHSIFWTNLAPVKQGGGEDPTGRICVVKLNFSGELAKAITSTFGSLDKFKV